MSNTLAQVTQVVTEAFLSITQVISQEGNQEQLLAVHCNESNQNMKCTSCHLWWEKYKPKPSQDFIDTICKPICECNVSNVKMEQTISINLQAWLEASAKDKFIDQLKNNLSQKSTTQNSQFASANTVNIQQVGNRLYQSMKADEFQKSLQGLSALQVLSSRGATSIITVNMNQAIEFINKLLWKTTDTALEINNLTTTILQASTQILKGGLNEIIEWIIQILLCGIVLVIIFYSMDLLIDSLQLLF